MADGPPPLVHLALDLEALVVEHGCEALVDGDLSLAVGHFPKARVPPDAREARVRRRPAFLLGALLGRHGRRLTTEVASVRSALAV